MTLVVPPFSSGLVLTVPRPFHVPVRSERTMTMTMFFTRAAIFCTVFVSFLHAADAQEKKDFPALPPDAGAAEKEFMGLPLVFEEGFESGKAEHWEPTDPKAWKVVKQGGNHVYSQFQASKYKTPVRSPFNRSVRKDVFVGDFVFDVHFQSTTRNYGHRDLCLFFGYQDPSHFYYVHFGKKADDHANQIFIVNEKPRTKISIKSTDGTDWDDEWHEARIVRNVKSGKIEVYFDNMNKPVMTAKDSTFTWGQVGVGSFDDTGRFDRVRLWGSVVKPDRK
jgi:hypothetical protein